MSSAHRCIHAGTHLVKKPNDGSCSWNLLQIGKLLTCPLQTWNTASSPSCPSNPPSSMFPVLKGPQALRERIGKPERSCGSSLLSLGLSFIVHWPRNNCTLCQPIGLALTYLKPQNESLVADNCIIYYSCRNLVICVRSVARTGVIAFSRPQSHKGWPLSSFDHKIFTMYLKIYGLMSMYAIQ